MSGGRGAENESGADKQKLHMPNESAAIYDKITMYGQDHLC